MKTCKRALLIGAGTAVALFGAVACGDGFGRVATSAGRGGSAEASSARLGVLAAAVPGAEEEAAEAFAAAQVPRETPRLRVPDQPVEPRPRDSQTKGGDP